MSHIFPFFSVASIGSDRCLTGSTYDVPSAQSGYISNTIAVQSGCGSMKSPWRIEATPGQSINISLINYTPPQHRHSSSCRPLAYIYDEGQNNNVTICSNSVTSQLYVSISHRVTIQLLTQQQNNRFLLEYNGKLEKNLCIVFFIQCFSLLKEYVLLFSDWL